MGLTIAKEINVIGNTEIEKNRYYYANVKLMKGLPIFKDGEYICHECNEIMNSPLGMYNGYSDCDEDNNCYQYYKYECTKLHSYSWRNKL